jgi:hypothetical protein
MGVQKKHCPAVGFLVLRVQVNLGVTKENYCNFANVKASVTWTAAVGYMYGIGVAETEFFVFKKVWYPAVL